MLRLITFDLDDTLWDGNQSIKQAELAMMQSLLPQHAIAAALNEYQRELDLFFQNNPLAELNIGRTRQTVLLRWLEGDKQRCGQAWSAYLKVRHQPQCFEGVQEQLSRLSRRYPLVALSNGMVDIRRTLLAPCFSDQIRPTEVGALKPHPAMFLEAMRRFQTLPQESLHIGDHPIKDIQAARNVGWHALRFANSEIASGAGEFTHFVQLPELLNALNLDGF
ncbi:MAG: HAD family hydrolase [Pseudomonadales bacterium]|nr:HAD family hydrolase [Pseudomonadales bacterium]